MGVLLFNPAMRTPFTAAILVLEMTDRHNVISHLMLAGMIATMVALVIDKHSLCDHLKYTYLHEFNKEAANESKTAEESFLNVSLDH